ncbi:hypothetical protein N7495_003067 [Penicillium taxi]|uniref:uncharacterized protein n=1 Tax=Penicillium taxi TaxID=168475 RepID=UPI0025450B48|nr:uncharacterized protein N7495_003067 [Penicillium taxi]KAJ5902539.1 hypothetical protein N7495_003067 [Penicillium taxi]
MLPGTSSDLELKIFSLEARLRDLRAQVKDSSCPNTSISTDTIPQLTTGNIPNCPRCGMIDLSIIPVFNNISDTKTIRYSSLHALLILSDSALPLGSFAYSSGLESYLAHHKTPRSNPSSTFNHFLKISIASISSTCLPYVLAGYRQPDTLETLDNDLDASTLCIVAQRASVAQGRALIGVWERSLRASYGNPLTADAGAQIAVSAVENFSDALKSSSSEVDEYDLGPNGHLAPLWGVVCRAMGLDLQQTAYVFVMNHAKSVLSAAVRASVMGPYQAQNILASQVLQDMILERIEREWNTAVEEAGQVVPALDLWVGRHELLYSRIFNS